MNSAKAALAAFFAALIFGLGLGIGGMTLPAKIIGFLDVFGQWDPSLAFVMIGAVGTHAIAYRMITKRKSPLFAAKFQVPTSRSLDKRLVLGSAIFGIGWGLGGFCPGPSLVASVTGQAPILAFVVSMIVGIYFFKWTDARTKRAKETRSGN